MNEEPEDHDPLPDWRADLAAALELIGRWHMPFGKYGPKHYPPFGMPLHDLPPDYVLWFKQKGFPAGKLGQLLALIADIYVAGAEQVFEPFRQVGRDQMTDKANGAGLGLTLVRRIVERHDGVVAVTSEPGRGTTFRVRLPALVERPAVRV